MQKILRQPVSYVVTLLAAAILSLTTACVSGGFQVTRGYSKFVNSQKNIILRVLVFILTSPVYLVTLIVDLVIYNTIDFWEGKVAAGDYNFNQDQKTYFVHHEITPDMKLKRSTIKVQDQAGHLLQTVILSETAQGEIELFVDGKKRAQVRQLRDLPLISFYDEKGEPVAADLHLENSNVAAN